MTARLVTVFGGNGFIGRHVVQRLVNSGARVRVACRDPESALFLKPLGNPGQIVAVKANITHKDEVARAVDGADAVINCVGVITPSGWNTLEAVHVAGASIVAKATQAAGIDTFIHVSALGADIASESLFLSTKAKGEEAVVNAFPKATILRPAVIVGTEDKFLNVFASIARWSPVIPMINPILPSINMVRSSLYGFLLPTIEPRNTEGSKFQPVVIADVADAIVNALDMSESRGQTYEITGPVIYTFRRLMELMLAATGRDRCIVSYPAMWAYFWAFFMEFVPGMPISRDTVTLLNTDILATDSHKNLADLGVEAHSIESVLPQYLGSYRPPSNRRLRPV